MLKYSVKLTDDNITQEEVVWGEKYLSPNLSFVTGVTSQDYHLEKLTKIPASNTVTHTPNTILPIETKNVTRQGFVKIENKEYKIETTNKANIVSVFLNGKYYYASTSADTMTFNIDNWLQYDEDIEDVVETHCKIQTASTSSVLLLDTIVWIEDGLVTIDGETYEYDFNLRGLRKIGDEDIIDYSGITECEVISFYPYSSQSKYKNVTKFKLTKDEETNELFERVSFIKRQYYILYKDHYFNIEKTTGNTFICNVDKDLLDGSATTSGTSAFTVYWDDYSGETFTKRIVSGNTLDALMQKECYVEISYDKYYVKSDILNANNGTEIGVYLDGSTYNVDVGDIIKFVDTSDRNLYDVCVISPVLHIVPFRGRAYRVQGRLCDTVSMNGSEFDIEYLDSYTSGECLVHIDEDTVMRMDVINSGNKLRQKGYVVSANSTSTSAVTMEYTINKYRGIIIDDKKYRVFSGGTSNDVSYAVEIDDLNNEYYFIVEEIRGSSLLICKPYLLSSDFNTDLLPIRNLIPTFSEDVVNHQGEMELYFKNKIFGTQEVTKNLVFEYTDTPTSSDDYFDLFDNLSIYTANAYIHLPMMFSTPHGSDLLQDEIIKRDFYENEKKKAINPIIDMEKDVYSPKYFDGLYSGSSTDFKEIREIRFNLHFRTRNLDSWKVNESYNNIETSGLCNWFVTDFYPYKDIMSAKTDDLLYSSDLVGLLYFTSDDVYFQRSNISKSFLRLSLYDSTDQQEQMLLGMSTVFMNERRLFQDYINNSNKNVYRNRYLFTEEVFDGKPNLLGKITPSTEFLNKEVPAPNLNGMTEESKKKEAMDKYNGEILSAVTIDDEHRLGSEFIIKNKYETDNSSEGYYQYVFREYSEDLEPKPMFMKVEFNHAGIGRTIPFIVPMAWSNSVDGDGYKYPTSSLTFSSGDLITLKEGIKLEDSYAQSYIPLYAVYDFKNKQYAYVFDNRYVHISDDGVATINLFEIKYAVDSSTSDNIQKEVTNSKQPTAKININPSQFVTIDKKCN